MMRGRNSFWIAVAATFCSNASASQAPDSWSYYGHDAGGQRFSPLAQINRQTVASLQTAWIFHTGDVADGSNGGIRSGLETTPLFIDGRLYLTTAFNRIIALDPLNGTEIWAFDPKIDRHLPYGDGFINRGVAYWKGRRPKGICSERLFEATLDDRLVAVDATTGRACAEFGSGGQISLRDVPKFQPGAYHMTSPPAVVDDTVIVGSAINDNGRVDMPSGVVRGYDVRTGRLRWTWHPLLPKPGIRSGAANAWSIMTVDPRRHLVFVPTGSASPDYYGGLRPGDDRWADSVVALDGRSGRFVWGFQLVHHDLWDYDTATPPLLADIVRNDRRRAVVVVASKSGFLYVLDRDTGRPVFSVKEQPVQTPHVAGEQPSLTQPVPAAPPALAPQVVSAADAFGLTAADLETCRAWIARANGGHVFAPPSTSGIVAVPGNIGGANWSGFSFDPRRNLLIVNTSNLPYFVRLLSPDHLQAEGRENLRAEVAPQLGAPFALSRQPLLGPSGAPCIKPPWGELMAIDLSKGTVVWREPLGTMAELNPRLDRPEYGSISLGGSIATAGGLIFVGGTLDRKFRAVDIETGKQLWSAELPASAHATPMTYEVHGRQFVVIAAGGSPHITQEHQSDAIVAFAIK